MRPLISDAIAALYAKMRASCVRGRRSIAKTTHTPNTTAARMTVAAMNFPRNVTPVLSCEASFTLASSSEPDQPEREIDRADEGQQHERWSRYLLQQPGELQNRSREE